MRHMPFGNRMRQVVTAFGLAIAARRTQHGGDNTLFGAREQTRTATACGHHPLKMACLPISPRGQIAKLNSGTLLGFCQERFLQIP